MGSADDLLLDFLSILQSSSLLEETLFRSLHFIVEKFGFPYGTLHTFDPPKGQVYTYSRDAIDDRWAHESIDPETLRASPFWEECQKLVGSRTKSELLREFPERLINPLYGKSFYGRVSDFLLVPLATGRKNQGLIKLVRNVDDPPLSSEEREVLELIGRLLGLDLARETAIRKERQLSLERATLLEIGRIITSRLEQEKTLPLITQKCRELVGVSRISTFLFDEKRKFLQVLYATDPEDPFVKLITGVDFEVDIRSEGVRSVFSEGKSYFTNDAFNDQSAPTALNRMFNIRSIMVIPIISHGKVIGAIYLDEPGLRHEFSEDDVRIMESVAAFVAIAIENARLFRESQDTEERVKELMLRLARTQEEERGHISRELSDSVYGKISEVVNRSEKLLERARGKMVLEELREALKSSSSFLAELKNVISDLRPADLEKQGFRKAIDELLAKYTAESGLRIEAHIDDEFKLDSLYENSLFRIAQEAFNNIHRHSRATRASFELHCEAGRVLLKIKDNGVGFDPDKASIKGGMGLIFMRERVELLRGSFELESFEGGGTRISISLPLPE
jgi:signal transduction histidine kinase